MTKHALTKQPMQPFVRTANGVIRFKSNALVDSLLERDRDRGRTNPIFPQQTAGGLNWLAMQEGFSQADWEQFYQLIGYSLTGYHELSNVSDEAAFAATKAARAQFGDKSISGCRDQGCTMHLGIERR